MGLDALLARLEAEPVAPATPAEPASVTAKPAPVLDRTPITPVTPPSVDPAKYSATLPLPGLGVSPRMSDAEFRACHSGGWSSAEVESFLLREGYLHRSGRADAEELAERLVLRDRQRDDRRLCLECAELRPDGFCQAAARGELPFAAIRVQPVPAILHRCSRFALAPGLR